MHFAQALKWWRRTRWRSALDKKVRILYGDTSAAHTDFHHSSLSAVDAHRRIAARLVPFRSPGSLRGPA